MHREAAGDGAWKMATTSEQKHTPQCMPRAGLPLYQAHACPPSEKPHERAHMCHPSEDMCACVQRMSMSMFAAHACLQRMSMRYCTHEHEHEHEHACAAVVCTHQVGHKASHGSGDLGRAKALAVHHHHVHRTGGLGAGQCPLGRQEAGLHLHQRMCGEGRRAGLMYCPLVCVLSVSAFRHSTHCTIG